MGGGSDGRGGDDGRGLGPGDEWEPDSTYSPTGTVLVPADGPGGGYVVVDEACGGDRAGAAYVDRFLTPMFRDVAFAGDLAYAVDGSQLWTLDVTDRDAPVRVALDRLPGRPVAVHRTAAHVWVATVDAGLHGYAVDEAGRVDAADPVVLFEGGARRVMDVGGADGVLYVALGPDGLGIVALDEADQVRETAQRPAGPFAVAVAVSDARVAVAACDEVWTYRRAVGPIVDAGSALVADEAEAVLPLPFGHAKGIAVDGDIVWVAAGVALVAFRVDGDPRYLGAYTDDVPGFYVNDAVVDDGFVYIAAGDESVRVVDGDETELSDGVPVSWGEPDRTVDTPEDVGLSDVFGSEVPPPPPVYRYPSDPIAAELYDGRLFVLGNFRWVGERTVFVFDLSIPAWLRPSGQYVQPDVGVALSWLGDRVVAHGSDGLHRVIDPAAPGTARLEGAFAWEPGLRETLSRGAALYLVAEDGLIARAERRGTEVAVAPVASERVVARGLTVDGARGYVADAATDSVLVFDVAEERLLGLVRPPGPFLGDAALHASQGRLLVYDRMFGRLTLFDTTHEPLPVPLAQVDIGACEAYDIEDFYSGARSARSLFVADGDEVHLFCARTADGDAALLTLAADGPEAVTVVRRVTLPARVYTHAAFHGDAVVLASFDNNRYESTVLACDRATGAPRAETTFTGRVNALLAAPDRLLALDGDFGLRELAADLTPLRLAPLAMGAQE